MDRLNNIGIRSTLYEDDVVWLRKLSIELHDVGLYSKAIYLDAFIDNAHVMNSMGHVTRK